MKRRAGRINPAYPLTKKIKCGVCGQNFIRRKGITKGKEYVRWCCRTKKEAGATGKSHSYSERKFPEICSKQMGTGGFSELALKQLVKEMVSLLDGSLEVYFYDGRAER